MNSPSDSARSAAQAHDDTAARAHPGAPGGRLEPALGALVRLFCARFMPEVEPPRGGTGERTH